MEEVIATEEESAVAAATTVHAAAPRNPDECIELKNIKYKTMRLNGKPFKETKTEANLAFLEKYLESNDTENANDPWCKLNKTVKTKKLLEFVTKYQAENTLADDEAVMLMSFLKDCIDRKKLHRVKDVNYDKTLGMIQCIPALAYTRATKHFTLKNLDKRISTVKALAPKKLTSVAKRNKRGELATAAAATATAATTAAATAAATAASEEMEVEVELC